MKAVVLAAGEGTRMRPLTDDKPKPLVNMDGKPILERCFDSLAEAGADGFVVVVGYMKEKIIEKYGEEYDGKRVVYAHQDERHGLAHALLQAEPYVEDDFLLAHGDNVFAPSAHGDLRDVARTDADATLLVEEVSDEKARNTAVVVVRDDRVVDIFERADDPPSNLSVVGFYSLSPSIFDACRRTEPSERGEHEIADAISLLADDCDVRAVRLGGDRLNVTSLCLRTQVQNMSTKTIGVKEEVYERLAAEKHEDESFSDTIDRLVENARSDWRRSFGKLEDEGDELRGAVKKQREALAASEAEKQEETLDEAS